MAWSEVNSNFESILNTSRTTFSTEVEEEKIKREALKYLRFHKLEAGVLKEIAEETTVPTIISLSNSLFNFETYDDLSFLKVTDKSMFPSFDVGDLLIIKDVIKQLVKWSLLVL